MEGLHKLQALAKRNIRAHSRCALIRPLLFSSLPVMWIYRTLSLKNLAGNGCTRRLAWKGSSFGGLVFCLYAMIA